MRILIFSITFRPFIGGAELAVEEILKRLPNVRATVITALLDPRLPRKETIGSVVIERVGWGIKRLDKYFFPFLAFRLASRLHREHPFEISQAVMANYAGLAALFFKLRFPKIPYLLTMQSGDSPLFFWIRTWWFYPLYRMVYTRADYIQAISNYLGYRAKRYGYRGPSKVIPNGVDYALFHAKTSDERLASLRQSLSIDAHDIVITTVSRLVYKNAVDQLILGFHEWRVKTGRTAKLLIIGEGKLKNKLVRLTGDIGAEGNVIFAGELPYHELPPYLHLSHMFVRPSRSEGMGNSFIEAMAAGVPVIGTRVGGIPDFLEHEVTGLFAEKDNPMSIAQEIHELVINEPLRRSLIAEADALVREQYDWSLIAHRMGMVYERLTR